MLAIVQCASSFLLSLLALFLATKTDINPNYKQKLDIQIMNKARVQKENMVQIQQLKEGNFNKKIEFLRIFCLNKIIFRNRSIQSKLWIFFSLD